MNNCVQSKALLASLVIAAAVLQAPDARAVDQKWFNAAAVCAPYTSSAPDYAKLRFRAEGIINDSDASKFVICNLPRDSETEWSPNSWGMLAWFRRTTSGTPPITSNQCTVTVGFNLSEPLQSVVVSAQPYSSTYGSVGIEAGSPTGDNNSYGTLVCRIAPGAVFDLLYVYEYDDTSGS